MSGRLSRLVRDSRITAVLAVVFSLVMASAAHATAAPTPALMKAPPVWLGLLVMFLLLALVISVSLIPSKRTHLD